MCQVFWRTQALSSSDATFRGGNAGINASVHRCRPAVSEATSYTFYQAKIAPPTAAATMILALRSSIRRQLRRPAHPPPKPQQYRDFLCGCGVPDPRCFVN